jgi:transcriptional regulator with XRE-family HTH domain
MISKRIELLISEKKLSKRAFSRSINCTDTAINNVISGRNEPGFKIIESILQTYDDISPEWLITGKGEMIRSDEQKTHPEPNLAVVSEEVFKSSQRQVDELILMLKQSQRQLDDVIKMYTQLLEREKKGGIVHRGNDAGCADVG